MTFTTNRHLAHRLGLSGAKPLLPPCAFMMCMRQLFSCCYFIYFWRRTVRNSRRW